MAQRSSGSFLTASAPVLIAILVTGICLLSCLPAAVLTSLYVYYQESELIYPGVSVEEISLQGKTLQQASTELHSAWNLEKQIQVMDGLHTWTLKPADLGLSLDALQTARQAYEVGRESLIPGNMGQMVSSMRNGWQVQPLLLVDPQQAEKTLELLNQQARLPAENPSINFTGDQIGITPGKLGYELNIEEALKALESDPAGILHNGILRIPLRPLAPDLIDFSIARDQAQSLLDRPLTIHGYDPVYDQHFEWTVPRETLASWLILRSSEAGQEVGISTEGVTSYLAALNNELGPERFIDDTQASQPFAQAVQTGEPFTIPIRHRPTQYTIEPGDTLLKISWHVGIPFWMILQSNPELNPDKLSVGQELVIPSKDDLLPLPVVQNKRIVISIRQQRLWMYQDGKLVAKHPISTGIDRSPTQPGIFQVLSHERQAYASIWDLTMPNFLGIYEAWPGFYNGIHGLPTLSNGRRLWANILGRPASFGCIILDLKAAKALYEWADNGVVVEIKP
jgi:lipoprotein-anchoring transpeptidase ErfK/SrfK